MEKEIDVSIVILSWNTREILRQCLESVADSLQQTAISNKPLVEIIVVDNGSVDGSQEMIKKYIIQNTKYDIRLIENKENLGFTKGNNIGIRQARGKYIMLLNSDTIVKEGAIEKMVDFFNDHADVDIVGPKLLNLDGSPQANCGRFPDLLVSAVMLFKEHLGGSDFVRRSPKESCFVDWLMGSAFLARKEVFEKIGGLDEKIFMYMEEVEWFYRAKLTGFKAFFLIDSEIIHLGRASSKSGKKEPILNIYKGLIHFYRKHKSLPELLILLFMLKLKAVIAILIGYFKNDSYLKQTYAEAFKIN